MNIYVDLFHGRNTPSEDMDGWGFTGPILGPFEFIHYTYGDDIKLGEAQTIKIESIPNEIECPAFCQNILLPAFDFNGLINFLGSYYGDLVYFTDISDREVITQRISRTKEVFSIPFEQIHLLLDDTEEWIQNFARYVLVQKARNKRYDLW
jgi:hypothetical protein